MGRVLFVFLLLGIYSPKEALADGFGWYANIVNPHFFDNLVEGGLDRDMRHLNAHMEAVIRYDRGGDNFPYDTSEIKGTLLKVAKNGVSFTAQDDRNHENQWYVLDVIIATPGFYDHQYPKSEIEAIGETFVSPRSLNELLTSDKFKHSYLKTFLWGEEFGTRFASGSCLNNTRFGKCIYSYIFLNLNEVQVIDKELSTVWKDQASYEIKHLKAIIGKAISMGRPMIFYGQD